MFRLLLPQLRTTCQSSLHHSKYTIPTFARNIVPRIAISNMSAVTPQQKEYRLKLDSNVVLKNGDKVEAEVEGLDGGKVLVVKVNGTLRAMGTKCTRMIPSPPMDL